MTLIDVSTLVGLGLACALALYALAAASLSLVAGRSEAAKGDCRERMLIESGEGAGRCPGTSA